MRIQPSSTATIVRPIKIGTVVEVTAKEGFWWRIKFEGKAGYMMAQYLKQEGAPGAGDMFALVVLAEQKLVEVQEILAQIKGAQ